MTIQGDRRVPAAVFAVIFVVLMPLAQASALGTASDPADPVGSEPIAVLGVIDGGFNVYHEAFRDDSPLAFVHPSEYIDGYPADTPALELTLDADSWLEAVLADCAVWSQVELGTLYWVPGTRFVGVMSTATTSNTGCGPGAPPVLPSRILDPGGHGTMSASRAAGDGFSLCPECRIAAVQGMPSVANMLWLAERGWVDAQTNSWGTTVTDYVDQQYSRADARRAASLHPVFHASGNGVTGFRGIVGHPMYTENVKGAEGILLVGGHDSGRVILWPGSMPHVVADAFWNPAVVHNSLDGWSETHGSGTSSASPFAAGGFAALVLEARRIVGDLGTGVRDGDLVVAADGAELPASGPLADGSLSHADAVALFLRTANPRPVHDEFDGPPCDPVPGATCNQFFPTTPVPWGAVPGDVAPYYFIGYGQIGTMSQALAAQVLRGEVAEPWRPAEDAFFEVDTAARSLLDEHQP